MFENPAHIERKRKKLLAQLKDESFLKQTTAQDFLPRLAYYFTELNYLHPFREGNGRATREYVRQLLLVNGYAVDWAAVSVDELLSAMGASVFDTAPLIQVLRKCVSRQSD